MNALDDFLIGRIADYLDDLTEGRIENPPLILEPFLKNGVVFSPKSGNIIRLLKSNAVFSFFLDKPGYAFLCEFFPKHVFNHESEKWFVVKNPETKSEAEAVLLELKKKHQVDLADDFKKNTTKDLFLSQDFRDFYSKPPLKIFGERYLPDTSNDSITWAIWERSKKVLFQDFSGQIKIGYRPVSFTKIKDNQVETLNKEPSPYYKANDEIYIIPVKNITDRDNMLTKFDISITAWCDNPYIADVEKDDAFTIMYSRVIETATKIVSSKSCHKAGWSVNGRNLEEFDPSTINDVIEKAIKDVMISPEQYFGFNIKELKMIGDISLDGKDFEEYGDDSKKMFAQQRENERAQSELDNNNTIAQKTAENAIKIATAAGLAYQEKIRLETEADLSRIKQLKDIGWDINLDQTKEIMEALGKGNGVNIVNIQDLISTFLNKNKKE